MKTIFKIITILLFIGVLISSVSSSFQFHCSLIVFCAFYMLRCKFVRNTYFEHIVLLGAVAGISLFSIISVIGECDNGVRIYTAEIETNDYFNSRGIMASPYNAQNFSKVIIRDFVSDSICKVYENGIYYVGKIDESLSNVIDNPELRQKYEASMDNGLLEFYRDYWYVFAIVFGLINVVLCSYSNLLGRLSLPMSFLVLTVINYICHSASHYLLFVFIILLIINYVCWIFCAKSRVLKDVSKCGGYIVTVIETSHDKGGTYTKYIAPHGKIVHKKVNNFFLNKNGIVLFPYCDDDDYWVVDENPSPALIEKFKDGVFIDAVSAFDKISLFNLQSSESMKEKYLAKY